MKPYAAIREKTRSRECVVEMMIGFTRASSDYKLMDKKSYADLTASQIHNEVVTKRRCGPYFYLLSIVGSILKESSFCGLWGCRIAIVLNGLRHMLLFTF